MEDDIIRPEDFDDILSTYDVSIRPFKNVSDEMVIHKVDLLYIEVAVNYITENDITMGYSNVLDNLRQIRNRDFYQFKKYTVISLFTILESAVKKFLVAQFRREQERLLEIKEIKNLEISFLEYNMMDEYERVSYMVDKYEQKMAKNTMYGFDRFEALLNPILPSSQVPSDVSRNIIELAQIRNCLLHRDGIADTNLKKKCPWLTDVVVGTGIYVSDDRIKHYYIAVSQYADIIIQRIKQLYGEDYD